MKGLIIAATALTLSFGAGAFAQSSYGTGGTTGGAMATPPGATTTMPPQTATNPNGANGPRTPDCPGGTNLTGSAGTNADRSMNCTNPESLAKPAPAPGVPVNH